MISRDENLVKELISRFGKKVLDIFPFPNPYCKDFSKVKAIYLGCDPSNKHSTSLQFAFALESGIPIFNKFIQDHLENLKQIKLDWNSVYVQNLC